ncbi:MAG: hypothetical protein IT307_04070 [Chloroflexi bacterium]|nr:hypothetical protein [Chloroflexota bacterium]
MRIPEFWRAGNGHCYRVRRVRAPVEGERGYEYRVVAERIGGGSPLIEEASVSMREDDLLAMVRLGQLVQTPEQLYAQAFERLVRRLGA